MHLVMNQMKAGTKGAGETTAAILIERVIMEISKMGNLAMSQIDGNHVIRSNGTLVITFSFANHVLLKKYENIKF